MIISPRARNLFKNVSSDVLRRLEGKIANGGEAVSPELLEKLTRIERTTVVMAIELLVFEAKVKQTRMIVRAIVLIAVLAALVIADPGVWKVFPEALHEFLEMALD